METPNINFIPRKPRYSDAELDNALIEEVFDQNKKKFQKEKIREKQTAKEAKTNVGKTHPVLGKCVANFPYPESIINDFHILAPIKHNAGKSQQ